MNKNDRLGLKAETIVYDILKKHLSMDFDICWTRRERRNNEPFDFEIYNEEKALLLIEVKGFSGKRKWYWTQFKRPAIKRKIARMRQLDNPRAITVVVGIAGDYVEIRWDDNFPSQPFGKFDEDLEFLLGEINENTR